MGDIDLLGLVSRWLHILSAIAAVGGAIFMRLALLPSVSVLADDVRRALHEAVRSRWSKVVMAAIAFLILSGVYNLVMIERNKTYPAADSGLYHGLLGVKLLLALAIFFIASALVGRSQGLAKIRQNARFWLSLNVTLAVILVLISGLMRATRDKGLPTRVKPAAAAESHFDVGATADWRTEA